MRKSTPILCLLFCISAWAVVLPARADNKSGVRPNVISLPSGPGSLEGLGTSFQPMLNTGTAKYEIKIQVPMGTAGHTPRLALSYEGGWGDGPAGIGWMFEPGAVTRRTDRGIPRYVDGPNGLDDDGDGQVDEPDEEDRFVGMEGEELVTLADGFSRPRVEGSFVRYRRTGDTWTAALKNGTRLDFGLSPSARVTDEQGSRTFSWLLQKSTDRHGNVIEYRYAAYPGSQGRKYLEEIRYGAGAPPWTAYYFVRLTYEARPDWRTDYRSGFLIKTAMRLKEILVGIQGVLPPRCAQGDWNRDGTPDALIRRYVLDYDDQTPIVSLLTRVTLYGSDGINHLPPIRFSYTTFSPAQTVSAAGSLMASQNAPAAVMDNELVDLVDLNRDGLPDILKTDLGGGRHTAYLNLGVDRTGPTPLIRWSDPADVASADGLGVLLHLDDQTVHLADMDGDGLSDLVQTSYPEEVRYFANGGDVSWGASRPMSITDSAPPAPFAHEDVTIADLDFDKQTDVVQSTDTGYRVWFNRGGGVYSKEVRTPGASYLGQMIRFSEAGVHLADMNGDRLSDVVRVRPNGVVYCAGMGHGRFAPAVELMLPDAVLTDGSGGQVERAVLRDINGDGLSDLVVDRAIPGELWYWMNLGTDTLSAKHVITDMPDLFGPGTVVRWADINGNGTTDLIYADSDASYRIVALDLGSLVGGSDHPNLLRGIENGLGVYTEIFYKSSTEFYLEAGAHGSPWTSTVPFPVQVVSSVRVFTGLDLDDVPGEDVLVKDYTYRDGFYEDRDKAFRGFSEVVVKEIGDASSPTRVSTHRFFTGGPDEADNDGDGLIDEVSSLEHREEDALKGKVRGVSVTGEDGFLFWEEYNDWAVRNLAVGVDGCEVRFAYNRMREKKIFEGTQTPETIRTTYLTDDFGNVTEEKRYGALSIAGDEVFTSTQYINDEDAWLLGLPYRQVVTDESLNKVAETLSYYDGPDYVGLALGQAVKGNLVRREGWVEGSTYVDTLRRAWDAYGNVVGMKDANGNMRTVTYETTLYRFPVQETIEVGGGSADLTIQAAYNLGLGVVTSSVDFNGHETIYGYDTFGRLTSVVRPGDTTLLPTTSFTYTMTDPRKGRIYTYDAQGALTLTEGAPATPSAVKTSRREVSGLAGTFEVLSYVDGLGRKLATVEEAETGFTVKDAVLFNGLGQVRYRFLPYASGVSTYTTPSPALPTEEIRYDASGRRVLLTHPPDAQAVITHVSTSYLPLSKTVTDENGNPKTHRFDGLQRLVEVEETTGAQTLLTRYAYDPLGNLTQVTDAQDNVTRFSYDGLSRKITAEDPDRGTMTFTYDGAGNLVQTTDNKGQVVVYTYDGAKRLLTEDYLDSALVTPDVRYHYDTPSAQYPGAGNTAGKLSWVEDLTGATFYSYDAHGNTLWTVKRITDRGRSLDFMTRSSYDAMGRLRAVTFPDGDTIHYAYNNGSLLEDIGGVIDDVDYHPSGARESVTFANGLKTRYTFDARDRMISLSTDLVAPSGSPLQDLSYSFDGAGNVTAVTDGRTSVQGTPEEETQSFSYDALHRLTRAQGPGYGAIDFQYDKIGNMIFKASPDDPDPGHVDNPLVNLGAMTIGGAGGTSGRSPRLPGDPPGPHAVTATASGMSFSYDDNGNMTLNTGDIYAWDFKDRLIRAVTSQGESSYTYGFSGRRVVKRVRTATSEAVNYYVNRGYEIREGRPVKYVFDGSRRIARIEGRTTNIGDPASQVLILRAGWNFFSLEVEPDDPAAASVLVPIAGLYTGVWSYDAALEIYRGYVPGQGITDLTEIHAGTGYLIHMTAPSILTLSGTRTGGDINLSAGWNLVPCPADSPVPLPEALSSITGKYEAVWFFDPIDQAWRSFIPGQPSLVNDLKEMAPGNAYWIKTTQSALMAFQERSREIYFYHPDHLGSTTLVTDSAGAVAERSIFFPFGLTRYRETPGLSAAYRFTGKERDQVSGLDYFEARYYAPVIGRFVSVDPLAPKPGGSQALHLYAYVKNNPMAFIDPRGLFSKGLLPSESGERDDSDEDFSTDKLLDDLLKTLLAIGLNVMETAVQDSGVKKYIEWAVGGIGLVEMGIEAFESGDFETILEFGLGAVETGIGVTTGNKLALLEMYQYGKGMYEMGKTAWEAASSDPGGAAQYAGVTAGMEVLQKGPEGAFESLLNRVKPPQLWQPNAGGSTPLWEKAKSKGREFLNSYVEEAVGFVPLLGAEERSMVQGATERMLY